MNIENKNKLKDIVRSSSIHEIVEELAEIVSDLKEEYKIDRAEEAEEELRILELKLKEFYNDIKWICR